MSVQATFCATLVDEWARAGVTLAFVAPGSRSTPLALALAADDRIRVEVHHDERCAAFMALGAGLASGKPAVALCTSGTAATHFHAAVVEAHHARVPLLVVTADRPPELRDVGAPQAIDQTHLYGRAVRWFSDPGPPDDSMRGVWRSLASRAILEASDGPVHLNLPFREPLVPPSADVRSTAAERELPPGRADGAPWTTGRLRERHPPVVGEGELGHRSLVVAARGHHSGVFDGAPMFATALALPRPECILRADALLRVDELRTELRPDCVVRIGGSPASRVVNEWIAGLDVPQFAFGEPLVDPYGKATGLGLPLDRATVEPDYLARWLELDAAADRAIAGVLADHPEPTEPAVARELLATVPAGGHLVVASSMPVRDLEWYGVPRADVTVHANRGANGIDGTISTAIGIALATGAPTAVLLGDVAFLHDSNALIAAQARGVELTIVVLDNDGGGIFSFLPQASALDAARFEQLFGTPHGVRPEAIAAAHGIPATVLDRMADLPAAARPSGVKVIVARTDRAANVALHDDIHAAVRSAVLR